uniref:endonuclease/exonuclease/phosphatase family protein n=1 Tax=Pararhizobium sp. IMCC3301 TaxID=3067904 RepID=UPI002741931C|nr:endonuclease/exonuclease/phosphatase family protein [Pararhizobium sp. IMCC3301]
MRSLFVGLAFVSGLFVVVGFSGPIHRSIDTISMGLPVFGLVCIIGIFAAKQVWLRLFFATTAIAACLTVASFFLPQNPGGDLRLYSKNLWYANSQLPALVADIEAAQVEVVMLQEVSDRNKVVLELLQKSFPFQHLCRFSGWSGIALASRYPFDGEPECSNWRAVAVAPIRLEGRRVWLVSAHIPWPWPYDSINNETEAERVLAGLEGMVVIGGDFNIMPWTGRVRRIASITNTKIAGPVRPTLKFRNLPLPIDFAMGPKGGSLEVRPLLGSDHAGIVANLKLWSP